MAILGEDYICILIFSENNLCLDQGNIHIFSGKVTENPNDMDIQMSKHDAFEHWNSARRVKWATFKGGKNQCLIARSK